MTRHIDLHTRTRPYWITRASPGWIIWDRRRSIGTPRLGSILRPSSDPDAWLHPTHAAAVAALDAHLREQAATEPSA